ncbi:MAG: hypothetical protein ACOZQL_00765 [Myxococcota bacterium]
MRPLRERLLPSEQGLLDQPGVAELPEEAQLAYVRDNRRLGFRITLVAGAVTHLMLGGAALALLMFWLERGEVVLELLGTPLLLFVLWNGRRWLKRLKELRTPV